MKFLRLSHYVYEMSEQQLAETGSNPEVPPKECIQKRLARGLHKEFGSILLGIYTFLGVFFSNYLHEVSYTFFVQEGLAFPSIPFTLDDVLTIGLTTGVASGVLVMLLTYIGKKRESVFILVITSGSLVVVNFGVLAFFKPLEPSIGPFFIGEFLSLLVVILCSLYLLFERAKPNTAASSDTLKLMHQRLLETFRFFSSTSVTSAIGGIVAILILSYEIFPLEIITGVSFTRFIGMQLLFGMYVLFGFFIGSVWQIYQMCKEIESRLESLTNPATP